AVRFLGSRGYRNAATRIASMVTGSKLRHADLTEKMAFFEAFGALVGPKGIAALEKMLAAKGLLGRKEDPETRACAAMALARSARRRRAGCSSARPRIRIRWCATPSPGRCARSGRDRR